MLIIQQMNRIKEADETCPKNNKLKYTRATNFSRSYSNDNIPKHKLTYRGHFVKMFQVPFIRGTHTHLIHITQEREYKALST